jgi:hypothetical protein
MATTQKLGTRLEGDRLYITGNTYPVRELLKDAKAHFDGDIKAWWIEPAKADKIEKILAGEAAPAAAAEKPKENPNNIRLAGKCKYKGRTYYARFIGDTKKGHSALLITLDQSIEFWAKCARPGEDCDGSGDVAAIVKTYQPRESGYGRFRRTEYTTLGSIQRFVKQQSNPDTRRGTCTECGSKGPAGEPCKDCGGEGYYA